MLLYLPPYSPNLSPIEESFSTCKAYLQRCGSTLQDIEDLIFTLLDLIGCVMAEMVTHWFHHAGYIVNNEL